MICGVFRVLAPSSIHDGTWTLCGLPQSQGLHFRCGKIVLLRWMHRFCLPSKIKNGLNAHSSEEERLCRAVTGACAFGNDRMCFARKSDDTFEKALREAVDNASQQTRQAARKTLLEVSQGRERRQGVYDVDGSGMSAPWLDMQPVELTCAPADVLPVFDSGIAPVPVLGDGSAALDSFHQFRLNVFGVQN